MFQSPLIVPEEALLTNACTSSGFLVCVSATLALNFFFNYNYIQCHTINLVKHFHEMSYNLTKNIKVCLLFVLSLWSVDDKGFRN